MAFSKGKYIYIYIWIYTQSHKATKRWRQDLKPGVCVQVSALTEHSSPHVGSSRPHSILSMSFNTDTNITAVFPRKLEDRAFPA